MAIEIISKDCSNCKKTKPINDFYKDKSAPDNFSYWCKNCVKSNVISWQKTPKGKKLHNLRYYQYAKTNNGKQSQKRYRQSQKGKIAQAKKDLRMKALYPDRYKARYTVNGAVRSGKIPRPDTLRCHYCPKKANEYHHWHGYEPKHWLDVVPACIDCHFDPLITKDSPHIINNGTQAAKR
jgi:hypothetical protein